MVSLIVNGGPFAKVFDSIWVFSPSARFDSAYGPLEKHIGGLKNKGGLVAELSLIHI